MPRKSKPKLEREEIRENVLRPCRYLGYDRDEIGMHLMGREAFNIAESQFRRAVWLNPFEPEFKEHLAWCLFQQHRYVEALPVIDEAIAQKPDIQKFKELKRLIEGRIKDAAAPEEPAAPPA